MSQRTIKLELTPDEAGDLLFALNSSSIMEDNPERKKFLNRTYDMLNKKVYHV